MPEILVIVEDGVAVARREEAGAWKQKAICPECNSLISTERAVCPFCGHTQPETGWPVQSVREITVYGYPVVPDLRIGATGWRLLWTRFAVFLANCVTSAWWVEHGEYLVNEWYSPGEFVRSYWDRRGKPETLACPSCGAIPGNTCPSCGAPRS